MTDNHQPPPNAASKLYAASHAPKESPTTRTAEGINTVIWFKESVGRGRVPQYHQIDEVHPDELKGRVRFFIPNAVVDVWTTNVVQLVILYGRRKLFKVEAGQIGSDVTISGVNIYDAGKLPEEPKSTSARSQ